MILASVKKLSWKEFLRHRFDLPFGIQLFRGFADESGSAGLQEKQVSEGRRVWTEHDQTGEKEILSQLFPNL